MITLVTGVPGSSKTLNTINEVLENDTYKNRPVYYYNIPEVTLKNWTELDESEAKSWFDLPSGSVVILDECQRIFRPMKYGEKVPKHIEQLETHRHLGIDIFIITQHPKLIDTKVRRLVGRHLHFKRQFGFESATRIEFQECADDPNDFFQQKESIKTRVNFPKNLYGVYKSSEQHTHKRKIPKKLYFVGLSILVAVLLLIKAVTSISSIGPGVSSDDSANAQNIDSSLPAPSFLPAQPQSSFNPSASSGASSFDWFELREPRVADLPSSAPLYDSLTEPKSFPRPQCIVRHKTGECSCYTQQATPLDISHETCSAIVAGGYFDETRPDPARSGGKGGNQHAASGAGGAAVLTAHERNLEALRIRYEIAELGG